MEMHTQITIQAKPHTIWSVLTDFDNYDWNPFIKSIEGPIKEGQKIKVELGGMTFKPDVLCFEQNKEFRWKGKLGIKGILDGEHYFKLTEQQDGSTLFEHGERFGGLLLPLLKKKLLGETKDGFIAMNNALKEQCEGI